MKINFKFSAPFAATLALVLILIFAGLRYPNFLGSYNILTVLQYNSMFCLMSIGMCFVIMTGGIDLSVGTVAALGSVVAAILSQYGVIPGVIGGVLAGTIAGLINGLVITRLNIAPFIASLAMLLVAKGMALLITGIILGGQPANLPVSYETLFTSFGQGSIFYEYQPEWVNAENLGILGWFLEIIFGIYNPIIVAIIAVIVSDIVLRKTSFGRYVLAVGGSHESANLMGLPVKKTILIVYIISGSLSGLAGVILASQFGAGQPTEGLGWELFAIASVVVGGTLLTGGKGSILGIVPGILILGLIYTILNFENGLGYVSLTVHWQQVVRGAFLLIVVIIQASITKEKIIS